MTNVLSCSLAGGRARGGGGDRGWLSPAFDDRRCNGGVVFIAGSELRPGSRSPLPIPKASRFPDA